MIPTPHITEHALLRWMERVHGVDVAAWRALMEADIREALDAYSARRRAEVGEAGAFILTGIGDRVVTFISADQLPSHLHNRTVVVARVAGERGGDTA